jgi:hypothetical protein
MPKRTWRSCKLLVMAAFSAALFTGCVAQPAQTDAMVPGDLALYGAAPPQALAQAVEMGIVSGGRPTNPLWMSQVGDEEFRAALERSLAMAGLLAPRAEDAHYRLDTHLVGLAQPAIGFDATVTSTIDYRLTPLAEGKAFHTVVIEPYTATVSDAFSGVERLRVANEGSIRKNITRFIDELTTNYAD